jgi:hypothetical protein
MIKNKKPNNEQQGGAEQKRDYGEEEKDDG